MWRKTMHAHCTRLKMCSFHGMNTIEIKITRRIISWEDVILTRPNCLWCDTVYVNISIKHIANIKIIILNSKNSMFSTSIWLSPICIIGTIFCFSIIINFIVQRIVNLFCWLFSGKWEYWNLMKKEYIRGNLKKNPKITSIFFTCKSKYGWGGSRRSESSTLKYQYLLYAGYFTENCASLGIYYTDIRTVNEIHLNDYWNGWSNKGKSKLYQEYSCYILNT